MRNDLIELLTLEDLSGEARELAECIGIEAFHRLLQTYGGTGRMYIPQPDMLLIPLRDRMIREEYNGGNLYELCRKWDLGESMVRKIISEKIKELRRAPMDGQCSFFDDG
ncbi:MAG: hypothetical protein HDT27_02040 [Subdoligranulum sp.]|nr:hypothetical protein [Subdoligranulum sp.]